MKKLEPAVRFLQEIFNIWGVEKPARQAASLAYYGLFSIIPILFIGLTVADIFLDELTMTDQLFSWFENVLGPEIAEFLEAQVRATSQLSTGSTPISSLISFGALLYAASGLFVQLQYALNTIWQVPLVPQGWVRGFIIKRLLAFVMVIGVGLLFVVVTASSVIVSMLSSLIDWGRFIDWGGSIPLVNNVTFIVLTTISFALIYKYLPDAEIAWRDVWAGAGVSALLLNLGLGLFGLYFSRSNIGSAFEAAGAVAVFLIAFNYGAQIFLFGAVFSRVYAGMFGSKKSSNEGQKAI
jgi:membrane protein